MNAYNKAARGTSSHGDAPAQRNRVCDAYEPILAADQTLPNKSSGLCSGPARRYASSSKQNPCPICGRSKDGDCRWGDDWIACHSGAAANNLKPGQTIEAEGQTWYLSRTGGGHSGMAHIYRPHRPGQPQRSRRRKKPDLDLHAQVRACRRFYAALRPRVHAALRLPLWECCTPVELRLVAVTFDAVQQLIQHLQQARRTDPNLARLVPVTRHWLKALGYQLADLQQFQRHQLGMQESWR